ncbi:MAG TPA: glycosyltransferase family 4 protein [Pyrinomonadaceae bacterium]|nr:glycosyltransferase family 4 protein [Pyrinomonadaceae bacterium]
MSDLEANLRSVIFCPSPMGIFEQSLSLQERGWLGSMVIDYYCDLSQPPYKWLPESRLRKYLGKRYHPGLDSRSVRTYPTQAVRARLRTRLARNEKDRTLNVFWHNSQVDRWVASRLSELGNLAFGYEGASLQTFRRAKQLGLPCVLYQPIACAEKALTLLGEEARLFPAVADTLRYNWFPDDEVELRREERRLADAVLCASTFTKQSLVEVGIDPGKVFVEPYGVDQTIFAPSKEKFRQFSVIWASSYTQTKGIGYLLEALARSPVPGIELVLAGYPFGKDAIASYEDRVRVRRVGHVSREELAQIMRRCHVHVFPTLIDGFGRNIIEAMASGLPVITTANCAGPDLIEDGVTGFLVPIRDVDAISEKLAWINDHPYEAIEIGMRARDRVASLTQADYRRRFADRIRGIWKLFTEA